MPDFSIREEYAMTASSMLLSIRSGPVNQAKIDTDVGNVLLIMNEVLSRSPATEIDVQRMVESTSRLLSRFDPGTVNQAKVTEAVNDVELLITTIQATTWPT